MKHYFIGILISVLMMSNVYADNYMCSDVNPGINLAGGEYGKVPGKLGHDYFFPKIEQLKYFKDKGFKSIRLPIKWERLQLSLMGDLNNTYLFQIQRLLKTAEGMGLCVLLDVHNYGRYRKKIIGSEEVPYQSFYDFWNKVATNLKDFPALYAYGLMNEPHDTGGKWHKAAQYGVDGIRKVDSQKVIYVAGEHWSSAWRWKSYNPRPFVTDPSNKIVYEAHIYFDKRSEGFYKDPDWIPPAKEVERRLASFVKWLDKYQQKGAIGEWGVPTNDPRWFPIADRFIEVTKENNINWFIWAGGFWSKKYPLNMNRLNGRDPKLTEYLQDKHFNITK